MGFPVGQEDDNLPADKSVTILYVDHSPVLGGAELSLIELAETLSPRYKPILVCTNECPAFISMLADKGIQTFVMSMPRLRGIRGPLSFAQSVRRLCRLIKRVGPDVIHSNTVRAHIVGAIAGCLCGVKVVWTIRDFTFPVWLYRLLSLLAQRIICASETVQGTYCLPNGKTSLVLNGITRPAVDKTSERSRIRSEFGIPEDAPLAASVGRLIEWKGQEHFLRAAMIAGKAVPNAYFMVVGDSNSGSYKARLRRIASRDGLNGRVIFTGFRSDALSCMCAADVVVHTSVEPEPFGRVLVEAMAVGTPVIASPEGGPAEIIEHGDSGLLVPPTEQEQLAEAIISVLTDVEISDRLSRGGRMRFEKLFDQALETAAIEDVYAKLLAPCESADVRGDPGQA